MASSAVCPHQCRAVTIAVAIAVAVAGVAVAAAHRPGAVRLAFLLKLGSAGVGGCGRGCCFDVEFEGF